MTLPSRLGCVWAVVSAEYPREVKETEALAAGLTAAVPPPVWLAWLCNELPVVAGALWWLYAAPRAKLRPALPGVLLVKGVVLGGGAMALYGVGHPVGAAGRHPSASACCDFGVTARWDRQSRGQGRAASRSHEEQNPRRPSVTCAWRCTFGRHWARTTPKRRAGRCSP
ncbi:YrdB family protein [Streptomyces sp. NRRL S-1022]|uniref:YrdB family protein n=1 Tax=Streptomyces sp. NRRL S-1022 TaxID=1463880 RepID=UPI00099C245D|nr:YrdB family protein [Streptomyces sp. NRRL S-1022]